MYSSNCFSDKNIYPFTMSFDSYNEMEFFRCYFKDNAFGGVKSIHHLRLFFSNVNKDSVDGLCTLIRMGVKKLVISNVTMDSNMWPRLFEAISASNLTHLAIHIPWSYPQLSFPRSLVYLEFHPLKLSFRPLLEVLVEANVRELNIRDVSQGDIELLRDLGRTKVEKLTLTCQHVEVVDALNSLNQLTEVDLKTDSSTVFNSILRFRSNPTLELIRFEFQSKNAYIFLNDPHSPEKVMSALILRLPSMRGMIYDLLVLLSKFLYQLK